ncbi:MAG: DNA cytosine methyltransferase [Planctomycetes bacterium]|nr:DNA cytosine methyltransferase [Planctomycetota bacterium]
MHGREDCATFAEFFAGVGLVRLALERVGWRCAFANDIDPKKAEMYRRNSERVAQVGGLLPIA